MYGFIIVNWISCILFFAAGYLVGKIYKNEKTQEPERVPFFVPPKKIEKEKPEKKPPDEEDINAFYQ